MNLTRRKFVAAVAAAGAHAAPSPTAWNRDWDLALLAAALELEDAAYDPAERMLKRHLGGEYLYHSALRNRDVHPTRDALDYALLLLEAGGDDRRRRAGEVIARTVALQDTDPESKWYGIWGWYMEEPPPQMTPAADWNWADFNGSLLLLIENRHGAGLPDALRANIRESIRHAAASVRRRNVAMTYTNIAVQGTFVTLAAAELLGDRDLMAYATERLRRFARTVDETGSFAEYNSPTYVNVTIANLTRIRMVVKDAESRALAERIHERAWLHLGRHWHVPSRQLAGPMSRCYRTDIGQPLWLQKALGGRLAFATLEEIRGRHVSVQAETAMLDYRCPASVAPLFLDPGAPRQHRELFLPSVQGTTWLDRRYTIGSINRGNFWIQSRPLVGYWGEGGRTGGYFQMRFFKDEYDFASALIYTVQERNCVLGLVGFRTPGGDKHPSLDPVRNGEFQAARLRLRIDLSGVPDGAPRILEDECAAVDAGPVKLWVRFPVCDFGGRPGKLSMAREGELLVVSYDLLPAPGIVRFADLRRAFAVLNLVVEETAEALPKFAARLRATGFRPTAEGAWEWASPSAALGLAGATAPGPIAAQDGAFRDTVDGRPVPAVRLSQERLV